MKCSNNVLAILGSSSGHKWSPKMQQEDNLLAYHPWSRSYPVPEVGRRAPSEITQGELNEKLILINTPLVQGSLCFLRGGIPGSMSAIPRRTL